MADDLRRPVRIGEWYSKTPAQWKALDRQRQRMYTNIGRIEETSDGQLNANACERYTDRGLVCKSYSKRAQKLGNHISNKCSHCISAHRACVPKQPDTGKTQKRKARNVFDLDGEFRRELEFLNLHAKYKCAKEEDNDNNNGENDASVPSSAAEHEAQEAIEQETESADQITTRHKVTELNSGSIRSNYKQPPVPVRADSTNATKRSQTAGVPNGAIHVLDLKKEVIASLNDDPLHVVSSAKWANHQLAMMARLEALEKEVRDLKRKMHEA